MAQSDTTGWLEEEEGEGRKENREALRVSMLSDPGV